MYEAKVIVQGKFIANFSIQVLGETSHLSYIEGSQRVPIGGYRYKIITLDVDGNPLTSGGDKFDFNIYAPENSFANFRPKDNKDGTYTIDLDLLHPSTTYKLIVLMNGKDISNSPFTVTTMSA
eukprot:TRINITY_DN4884_c0_g2_i1.p1 TRINITY_DN4884_c0_g2~~TRINITY_DN4884_c0_g2_i1.p1  ORF type:complete len:123 (-),score=13.60 TRINITY_DN4884_c0_g2_i1:153-521(-)